MAHFMAEKARASGMPQEMGPLNPYERRIVHIAIAEDPTVSSESIGDAFMKTVIISAQTVDAGRRVSDALRGTRMFSSDDTIVAIATPPGRGGIGVVRLSGPCARDRASQVLTRREPLAPREATLTKVLRSRRRHVARAATKSIVTWFPAPHSYTGEDVVEISTHGSPVVLREIVRQRSSQPALVWRDRVSSRSERS